MNTGVKFASNNSTSNKSKKATAKCVMNDALKSCESPQTYNPTSTATSRQGHELPPLFFVSRSVEARAGSHANDSQAQQRQLSRMRRTSPGTLQLRDLNSA